MAAVDLSAITNIPYIYKKTGIGTTWQEFKFPGWVTKVTVVADHDIYLGFVGEETPADGGSVGTHKLEVDTDASATVVVRDVDDNPTLPSITLATSFFIASRTATADVVVVLESGRD